MSWSVRVLLHHLLKQIRVHFRAANGPFGAEVYTSFDFLPLQISYVTISLLACPSRDIAYFVCPLICNFFLSSIDPFQNCEMLHRLCAATITWSHCFWRESHEWFRVRAEHWRSTRVERSLIQVQSKCWRSTCVKCVLTVHDELMAPHIIYASF